MDNPILQIINLSIGYKAKNGDTILYGNLNAELQEGKLTCLIGPNGAGKSTLLRTLCNLQPLLGGEIKIEGTNKDQYTAAALSKKISIVLTDTVRAENITAYEVIALGRSPYTGFWGSLNEKDKDLIDQTIALLGLETIAPRNMQHLSDGERQKVMIAKAIVQETPIIMLDEPSAFLDYASKVKLMVLLRKLTRELNKTILISTHDLEHALQLSDNVWLFDKTLGFSKGETPIVCEDGTVERYFNTGNLHFDKQHRRFEINVKG